MTKLRKVKTDDIPEGSTITVYGVALIMNGPAVRVLVYKVLNRVESHVDTDFTTGSANGLYKYKDREDNEHMVSTSDPTARNTVITVQIEAVAGSRANDWEFRIESTPENIVSVNGRNKQIGKVYSVFVRKTGEASPIQGIFTITVTRPLPAA
ncbi:hypothetical protein DXG01_017224 [Tephrocybe rancida]|nr:hypothetical protein DXG01_017224 [Tephrocybe rancida]